MSFGGSICARCRGDLPKLVVRPDGVWVIMLFAALHSDAGTCHSLAAALNQHDAGGGAALTDILVRFADAAAAAGGEIAPHALARDVLAGRRIFGRHLRPVAFELLGDELGEPVSVPWPISEAGDPDDDGVVGPDHNPRV